MKWFDLTEEAKHQMEKLLSKHPEKYAVSLAVKGGGCAGFKYEWGFIDKKEDVGADVCLDFHRLVCIMCMSAGHQDVPQGSTRFSPLFTSSLTGSKEE